MELEDGGGKDYCQPEASGLRQRVRLTSVLQPGWLRCQKGIQAEMYSRFGVIYVLVSGLSSLGSETFYIYQGQPNVGMFPQLNNPTTQVLLTDAIFGGSGDANA